MTLLLSALLLGVGLSLLIGRVVPILLLLGFGVGIVTVERFGDTSMTSVLHHGEVSSRSIGVQRREEGGEKGEKTNPE